MTDKARKEEGFQPSSSNVLGGWSQLFLNQENGQQAVELSQKKTLHHPDSYCSSLPPSPTSEENDDEDDASDDASSSRLPPRRKSSIKVGRRVLSELLDNHNVTNAIHILKQALNHLNMTQQGQEDAQVISEVYSNIIKSLCDPYISDIVDEMSLESNGKVPDLENSVMWRLVKKVIESGHVLDRSAHLAVVDTCVGKHNVPLAIQAMYALPRNEWDTRCYHETILLHLIHDPMQVIEAQGLVSDYGRSYLEIANPIAPNDLPPIRTPMPLMADVTDQDKAELIQFYEDTLEANDRAWHSIRVNYEMDRKENIQKLNELQEGFTEWAMNQLNMETTKGQLNRISTENDNKMIQIATERSQFIYGWNVYEAMDDAVDEFTPSVVMHMCWVAFDKTSSVDISRRAQWEKHAFNLYSRFMCSEYLHPEQKETPDFLHDMLSIVSQSPEILVDEKARYTKTMVIYQFLVRLQFDTLLCDERVLSPILRTLVSSSQDDQQDMCSKAFEIWERKLTIKRETSYSMLWGLFILCLRAGQKSDFDKVIEYLFMKDQYVDHIPSSLLAPIQVFHDIHICNGCYFYDYMFHLIQYTDDESAISPIFMDQYGFLHKQEDDENVTHSIRTNINEIQARSIGNSVLMGVSRKEKLVPKQMYYSKKKAKALIRHCLTKSNKES